jgi:esterase FrsA
MPEGEGPFPTVLMCGGLDSLQIDYYSLYERYFAPKGIAMLTLDMPSIGFSSKWKLTQDSSLLHQHALKALENIPWVDHTRVAAFGFRFGANVAVRLAYLESSRLKAVACLGPVVHALLSDPARQGAYRKCTLMCWPAVLACMMHQTKRCALSSIVTR